MEKALEQALLFDFYGELLTEHQREIFQMHFLDDYSLGEISAEKDITRQAIFDLLKRSEKTLQKFEDKLGLVARFVEMKLQVEALKDLTNALESDLYNEGHLSPHTHEQASKIKQIVNDIYQKL